MEDMKVTILLDDYEQLIRIAERVNQAICYINMHQYNPDKYELLSILSGGKAEGKEDE